MRKQPIGRRSPRPSFSDGIDWPLVEEIDELVGYLVSVRAAVVGRYDPPLRGPGRFEPVLQLVTGDA